MPRLPIGQMLMQRGRIDAAQLESALAHQRRWGGQLGRAVVHLGFISESALAETVAEQLGVAFVSLAQRTVPPQVLSLLPVKLMRTRRVLPLARLCEHRRGPLLVAVPDPGDLHVLDEIAFATGLEVRPVVAAEGDLERAIARHVGDASPTPVPATLAPIELPADTSPLSALRRPEPARVAVA
jgi:type IV pilus assembly protein PilB